MDKSCAMAFFDKKMTQLCSGRHKRNAWYWVHNSNANVFSCLDKTSLAICIIYIIILHLYFKKYSLNQQLWFLDVFYYIWFTNTNTSRDLNSFGAQLYLLLPSMWKSKSSLCSFYQNCKFYHKVVTCYYFNYILKS